MDVFIRKGGVDAPVQWDNVDTFDWPDNTNYLIHDLIPNTHYGIKLMRFEKYTGTLIGSLTIPVYIPAEGEPITYISFQTMISVVSVCIFFTLTFSFIF